MEKEQYEETCEKLGLRKVENETFAIGPFTFDLLPDATVFVKYVSAISCIGEDLSDAILRMKKCNELVKTCFEFEVKTVFSRISETIEGEMK